MLTIVKGLLIYRREAILKTFVEFIFYQNIELYSYLVVKKLFHCSSG